MKANAIQMNDVCLNPRMVFSSHLILISETQPVGDPCEDLLALLPSLAPGFSAALGCLQLRRRVRPLGRLLRLGLPASISEEERSSGLQTTHIELVLKRVLD